MAKIAPRLGIPHVSPEEGRELLPRVRPAYRNGQIGEQRLGLFRRKDERAAIAQSRPKSA